MYIYIYIQRVTVAVTNGTTGNHSGTPTILLPYSYYTPTYSTILLLLLYLLLYLLYLLLPLYHTPTHIL